MKELRPYQHEAINALYKYWDTSDSGNGLIVIPTAGGKSLIIAALIKDIVEKWNARVLILTHVKELIEQDHQELLGHWPEAPVGIFSAGLGRKDKDSKVIIAGIQSMAAHVHKLDPPPEIVIIDEAHLVPRNDSTRYLSALKTLRQMYPQLRVVGLSATPYRLDSGWLHHGDGAIFDQIVYEVPVQKMIDAGYLCHATAKATKVKIDTRGVAHSGREFNQGALEDHILASDVTKDAVADMIERAADRHKWLVFAAGIKHAKEIDGLLRAAGIESGVISQETPSGERRDLIAAFRGESLHPIRCLVNVNVLTTGFNAPGVDFIALMRPTESVGLYVQMVGRGLRTHPSKADCLIADYAGLTIRHGPIDAVDPARDPSSGEGVAPAKECPGCSTIILAGLRTCPVCGFEFPPPALDIRPRPAEAPILKEDVQEEELQVTETWWDIHHKPDKPDTVKITYLCGALDTVREWISPQSGNQWGDFHYRKFCKSIGMTEPYPATAADFLDRESLPQAEWVSVIPDGKWMRVKRRAWKAAATKEYSDIVPF
jgi:DNA repair protein RadD